MNRRKNSTQRPGYIDRRTVLKLGSTAALLGLTGSACGVAYQARSTAEPQRASNPGSTLIRNAHVLSMDSNLGEMPGAGILISDGQIRAIGHDLQAIADHTVDASGKIALPGFVDGHRHLWQTPMRGAGTGWSFSQYIREMLYRRAVCYEPHDMYIAGLAGGLEALNAGITSVADYSHNIRSPEHADGAVEGMLASGIGGIFGYCYGRTPSHGPGAITTSDQVRQGLEEGPQWRFEDARRVRDKYFSDSDSNLRFGIATSFFETFAEVNPSEAVDEFHEARKIDAELIMQHVRARGSFRAVEFLDNHDLLGPDLMLAHGDWVTVAEYETLARHGVKIIVTPETELKGGNFPALSRGHAVGMGVGLGMDTVIMVGGDMFGLMRMMQQIQRYKKYAPTNDPSAYEIPELSDRDILRAATIGGARALGIDNRVGTLAPGKQADIQIIDGNDINMMPMNDAVATVVHQAHVGNIESVWVAGRQVKADGRLLHHDINDVVGKLTAARDQILERAATVEVDGDVDLFDEANA